MRLVVRPAGPADAGELLTLQRAAFVSEAQAYGDANIPPLRDGVGDVSAVIADDATLVLVAEIVDDGAVRGEISDGAAEGETADATGCGPGPAGISGRPGRLVASARARAEGTIVLIGRIVVAPDLQGRGLGTRMLRAVEVEVLRTHPTVYAFELFTGAGSAGNLRLYRREGYEPVGSRTDDCGVDLTVLRKDPRP